MTRILVPTDFSPAADNAARYALQLAKKMKTGIRLWHATAAADRATDMEDAALVQLAKKLEWEERGVSSPQSYHPDVYYGSRPGSVRHTVVQVVAEQKISLVVMGMSGAGAFSRLFPGSNSRELIDAACAPLLLVPRTAVYTPPQKIAFATELNREDIEVIQAIAGIARLFNAELLIAHCTGEKQVNNRVQQETDVFLSELTGRAGYDKIYYRQVKSRDVEQGLDWLAEHGRVDILAMVHRPHDLLARLLKGSHTQKIARHISIPLLVMPPGYCGTF